MEDNKVKIYVSPAGGLPISERSRWIELPMPEDELVDILDGIRPNEDSELMITDYTGPFKFGEFENIVECNEVLNQIINEEMNINFVATLLDYNCETLSGFDDCRYQNYAHYEDVDGLVQVAQMQVDDGFYGEVPESLKQYIDIEAIAVDLDANGWIYYPQYRTAICPLGA